MLNRRFLHGLTGLCFALALTGVTRADVGLTLKAGTLGAGADLTFPLGTEVNLRIGGNYFQYNYNNKYSDVNYNAKLKLGPGLATLDWLPVFRPVPSSGGALINGNELDLTGQLTGGSYNINGDAYTAAQVGVLTGKVALASAAPYAGIGWGNALRKNGHWSVALDLGAAFQGDPKLTYASTGSAAGNPTFQSDPQRRKDQAPSMTRIFFTVLSSGVTRASSYKAFDMEGCAPGSASWHLRLQAMQNLNSLERVALTPDYTVRQMSLLHRIKPGTVSKGSGGIRFPMRFIFRIVLLFAIPLIANCTRAWGQSPFDGIYTATLVGTYQNGATGVISPQNLAVTFQLSGETETPAPNLAGAYGFLYDEGPGSTAADLNYGSGKVYPNNGRINFAIGIYLTTNGTVVAGIAPGNTTLLNNYTYFDDFGAGSGTLSIVWTPTGPTGQPPSQSPAVSAPVITSSNGATGIQLGSFLYQITATNSPTSYSATGTLPQGLSLDPSTGIISGTPAVAGTFTPTIGATNGGGTGTALLTITIAPAVTAPVAPPLQPPISPWKPGAPTTLDPSKPTSPQSGEPVDTGTGAETLVLHSLPPDWFARPRFSNLLQFGSNFYCV